MVPLNYFTYLPTTVSRVCLLCCGLKHFCCLKDLSLVSLLRLLPNCKIINWNVLRNNPALVPIFSLKLWKKIICLLTIDCVCTQKHPCSCTHVACGSQKCWKWTYSWNDMILWYQIIWFTNKILCFSGDLFPFLLLCSYSLRENVHQHMG